MKKIYIFFTYFLLFFLISCGEDFLDTTSYTERVVGNFYQTPADAFEGLVAAYDPIRWGYFDHIILLSEIASDNCFGSAGVNDDDRLIVWDTFNGSLYASPHDAAWQRYYVGIYRVNILLENIGNVNWGAHPELEKRYTAEARFLRAYYYFDLVHLFGHIPLLKKVLSSDELNVPQADPKDVYEFIAQDLKYSIENLEPIPYQDIPIEVEGGRVTKWAAEALMCRAFLYYTGYYNKTDLAGVITIENAREYIDDLINNSGHDLVPNYANLWKQAGDNFVGEDNIETVFGIKYTYLGHDVAGLKNLGNSWQVMISPRDRGYGTYTGGWGACTVNPTLYYEWPENDTRRDASIIAWSQEGINFIKTGVKEYSGFNWKKFVPLAVNGTNLTPSQTYVNPDDKPEIRFSDALLMGAELHLDDNPALAQTYLDRVRDRAFMDDHRVPVTKSAIMDERKWEFAFEGQRYWDLLRQGLDVAKDAIDFDETDTYFDSLWVNPLYGGDEYLLNHISFRKETGGLFSIPETQISLSNKSLVQNPGW
jgi:hypothetical protein